jgi:Galactose oxidase, central domain
MKQRLRWKWLPIQPKPDPEYSTPFPRSSHGLTFLKHRNSFISYGGEAYERRKPIGHINHCWECYLGHNTSPASVFTPKSHPFAMNQHVPQWRHIDFLQTNHSTALPPHRLGHAQALYADRFLFIFGGRTGPPGTERNDLWMLDTEDWTWMRVLDGSDVPLPPRAHHAMICIGESLYIFGGSNKRGDVLNELHQFDLRRHTWMNLGRAPAGDRWRGVHLQPLSKTRLLVTGGGDAPDQMYDLEQQRWESLRDRSHGIGGVSAVMPSSGVAVIFGGQVPNPLPQEDAKGPKYVYGNDMVVLNAKTGNLVSRVDAPPKETGRTASQNLWPEARAWSAFDGYEDEQGMGHWFLFGGLGGEAQNPEPLLDVWKFEVQKVTVD